MVEQIRNQEQDHITRMKVGDAKEQRTDTKRRTFVLVGLIAVVGLGAWWLGDELSLSRLAARESAFRTFQAEHPILVYFAAFAAYTAVSGLSLPGAAGMTLLFGWLFGFWRGMFVVSFASTAGATIAFLLSRYLLRDSIIRRFGDRLAAFNTALEREGAFYLFTLRLIPAVPFFVINAVMGLTPIRVRTFWWVSQLGMLPGSAVFVYAGASAPRLQILAEQGLGAIFSPAQVTQILVAFGLLGLFPLLVRLAMKRLARTSDTTNVSAP